MALKTNGNEADQLDQLSHDLGIQFAYPNSRKIYLSGSRPDMRVPLREIGQDDTVTEHGREANPPIPVYDTSGAYGDPNAEIDLKQGLPHIRSAWIDERRDSEILSGLFSKYGKEHAHDPKTAHLRFNPITRPRRAKAGRNVTQMHYARQGIITPEMEFVALREQMKMDELFRRPEYAKLIKQHAGEAFGAQIPIHPDQITPEFVRREVAAEAAAREQVIAARAQEEAMKHVLPFKQRQIEQRQLEAEAERVARVKAAEGSAQARRIEANGEADARQKLAEAEAFRMDRLGKVNAEQMAREGTLVTRYPLLIQKTLADKLSDKIQVIIAPPPTNGDFIGAALLGGSRNAQAGAASVAAEDANAAVQEQ